MDSADCWRVQQNQFIEKPQSNPFSTIVVDTNKVKSWIKTKLENLNSKLLPIKFALPSKNTLPPLALGFFLAYLSSAYSISWISDTALSIPLKLLAISTITLLIKDIIDNYKMLSRLFIMSTLHNPNLSWRSKSISQVIKHYGCRYIITFGLAVFLFNLDKITL